MHHANEFDPLLLEIQIQQVCDGNCVRLNSIHNEITWQIGAAHLRKVVAMLLEQLGELHLSAITAQQRQESPESIELLYHFWHGRGFTLKMLLPMQNPQTDSILDVLPAVDFYEREAAEMYGVIFSGRTETPPLLLPKDWQQQPPMRMSEEENG